MLKQDDPKKCTAAKLVKFGLASQVKKTTKKTLVLNPYAEQTLLPKDKNLFNSITSIDCSWNMVDQTFTNRYIGVQRKLPPLLAGNPVNYSKPNKLTTVEAIAGAIFILGYAAQALDLLDKFKWGYTFFELNKNLLDDYSKTKTENDIMSVMESYGIHA
jgi:pre-rRNA-processing protein TSR3